MIYAAGTENYAQQPVSNTPVKPVIVIVHGAWGGGWAFREVDSLLSAGGYKVYRPTLTGQGERVHLASSDIGLDTHIKDIVNVFLYEELKDVILVGHSYGGMVITGVADSIPERIRHLIYADAFLPYDKESVRQLTSTDDGTGIGRMNRDGFVIPVWVKSDQQPPKDVPHSLKTFTDILSLTNERAGQIPGSYILTVDKGKKAEQDAFSKYARRASERDWPVYYMETGHNMQWSMPEEFVILLTDIINETNPLE